MTSMSLLLRSSILAIQNYLITEGVYHILIKVGANYTLLRHTFGKCTLKFLTCTMVGWKTANIPLVLVIGKKIVHVGNCNDFEDSMEELT